MTEVVTVPVTPEADEIIGRFRAGAILVALRVDDVAQRAAILETIVEQMVESETKLAWIGNPLRSPLTIERVFLQAVGADADLRVERSPADLARILAKSAGDAHSLLLILQQPETLDANARDTIGALAEALLEVEKPVQILFSGTTSFTIPNPPVSPTPPPMAQATKAPATVRRNAFPILLLLALFVLGALAYPVLTARSPAATPSDAPAQTASTPMDVATLRREFDNFLAQRAPTTPPMSDAQKDTLFQEFLSRRPRQSSASM